MNAGTSARAVRASRKRERSATFRAAGLVPLTTTDFPGRLAAVIFSQGCPWHCGYCQNPHLIPAKGDERIEWASLRDFLARRRGLLDGVVFSGGEPVYQRSLSDAVAEVAALGFEVGLHTGGAYPERLRRLLPQLDWVGLDIKAPFDDYERVTGVPFSGERARRSLEHLLASGVAYEVRTTVHPLILTRRSLLRLAHDLADRGVCDYALQGFRADGCANQAFRDGNAEDLMDPALCRRIEDLFERFQARTA